MCTISLSYNHLSDCPSNSCLMIGGLNGRTYQDKPDTIDISEFMVITNVVLGCNNIIALFWENKLGVDVNVCDNHFCALILGVLL